MVIRVECATMKGALSCRAGANEVRYYLSGIFIDTDGSIVSTDGAMMFVGKITGEPPAESRVIRVTGTPPLTFEYAEIDDDRIHFWKAGLLLCDVPIETIEGNYPHWQRIANGYTNGECKAFGISGKYLRVIGKIAKPFCDRVLLEPAEDNVSVMRWTFGDKDEKANVYLMPLRV